MSRSKHKSAPGVAPVPHHTAEGVEPRSATARALDTTSWIVIVAGVILIPLWVSPTGEDSFRYPKELLFIGEAIVLVTILVLNLVLAPKEFPLRGTPRYLWGFAAAVISWTAITTLTSTHVYLSARSLHWVAVCTVVFLITFAFLRRRSESVLWLAIVPAVINAVIAILQAFNVWHPVETTGPPGRMQVFGLLGNPNDLGAFLVVPALAATALVFARQKPLVGALTAAVLVGGIAASGTFTAIIAYGAGFVVILAWMKRRIALTGLLVLIAAVSFALWIDNPLKDRVQSRLDLAAEHQYDQLSSFRLSSSLVGFEMLRDFPITGAGPGSFGANFFDYRLRVADKYASILGTDDPRRRVTENFGELHNDHLEVAAETGVPGYLLFLSCLLLVAWTGLRRGDSGFLRTFAPVAVVGVVVMCVGLFPFQLAATAHSLLFFAACVLANSGRVIEA